MKFYRNIFTRIIKHIIFIVVKHAIIIYSWDDRDPVALMMEGGGGLFNPRSSDSHWAGFTENPSGGSLPKDIRSSGS